MPELVSHNLCTGCTACESACPNKCIKMISNQEGFLYPSFENRDNCVNCLKCENACPILNPLQTNELCEAFAAINPDEQIRMSSSSGGLFRLIGERVLDAGGVVFAAIYNENMQVVHTKITSKEELYPAQGAKYSQSFLGNTFSEVQYLLEEGKNILFVGTPCQVAGLKSFLMKEYQKLLTIDFVCHGVPSPLTWEKYLDTISKKYLSGEQIKEINLRDKVSGWSKYSYSTTFRGNSTEYTCTQSENIYMKLFINNAINRLSCSDCKYKGIYRVSDITLGDFWGIWALHPEMDDNKGTSVIILHSVEGRNIWNNISSDLKWIRVSMDEAVQYNLSATVSDKAHLNRSIVLKHALSGKWNRALDALCREEQKSFGKQLKEAVKIILSKSRALLMKSN